MAPRHLQNHIHVHVHILPRVSDPNPTMNSPQPSLNPINPPIPIPPLLADPFPPESAHPQVFYSKSNYTQPRTPPIPTSSSSIPGSDATSTIPPPSETSQTSSLWSSSYASGSGAKLATVMDLGMIFVLAVFLGVIFIQWKRRTGAVSLPVALQVRTTTTTKNDNDNDAEKGHNLGGTSSDEKQITITPPRPARSRHGSECRGGREEQKQKIPPSLHEAYFSTSTAEDDETKKANNP